MRRTAAFDLPESYALIHGGACALEIARDVVIVRGPDAVTWLQGQLSQDVNALGVGGSAESLVLSPQGKIDAYCRVTRLGDEEVLLDTEIGHGQHLYDRLRRFRLRVKAELEIGVVRCAMVRGPDSAMRLEASGVKPGELAGQTHGAPGDDWIVAVAVAWPGLVGYDVMAPAGTKLWPELDALAGNPAAFEAARIEAGVPAMGRELTDKTIPQEAGLLVEHAVSFSKGCYTGQELVARLDARGGNVARRLRGVVGDPRGDLAEGSVLVSGDREVGRLTSVAWSPRFAAPVGLAYVRREVVPPAAASVTPGDWTAQVRELPL